MSWTGEVVAWDVVAAVAETVAAAGAELECAGLEVVAEVFRAVARGLARLVARGRQMGTPGITEWGLLADVSWRCACVLSKRKKQGEGRP